MNTSEPLWTVNEVAVFLHVSKKWVYEHAAKGRLPCIHVGGLRRFKPAAIRGWLEAHQFGSASPLERVVAVRG